MSVAASYIDYYNSINVSTEMNFFKQRQKFLMKAIEKKSENAKVVNLNRLISRKQAEYEQLKNTMEQTILKGIQDGLGNNGALNGDLEIMASNIEGYLLHAGQESVSAFQIAQQQDYMQAYYNFKNLIESVLMAPPEGIEIQTSEFITLLNKLDFSKIQTMLTETGNSLGYIGELSGLMIMIDIAQHLLENFGSFGGSFNLGTLTMEIQNTGQKTVKKKGSNKSMRIGTDNLLIIKQGNQVLFTLNLSNKFNTKYKANMPKKKTTTAKLVTQSVGSFLVDNPQYAYSMYNIISYHWDRDHGYRTDFGLGNTMLNGLMRQTIGGQMLYQHIFGTGKQVNNGTYSFADTISLIAYGTKIYATSGVLDVVKKRGKFNKAQIDTRGRNGWCPYGSRRRSIIEDEFEAQRRIAAFTITYSQSLGQALN